MSRALIGRAGTLMLVNASHPMEEEPPVSSLVPVDKRYPEILLQSKAASMLCLLLRAVGAGRDIIPVSGYRPRREQQQIWDSTLLREGRRFTQTYVAQPGCSEHQTGLAIDLGENRPDLDFIRPQFPDTGVFRVFRLRAADYGFVLRYPQGRERITGIGYEPWHFRYVGWPHARIMAERDLVLEEYLDWLRSYPEGGAPLCYRTQGRLFELFHVPAAQMDTLEDRLPQNLPWQWSWDNAGGGVVTLWRSAG